MGLETNFAADSVDVDRVRSQVFAYCHNGCLPDYGQMTVHHMAQTGILIRRRSRGLAECKFGGCSYARPLGAAAWTSAGDSHHRHFPRFRTPVSPARMSGDLTESLDHS